MLNPIQQIEFTSRVRAIADRFFNPQHIIDIANIAEECHRNQFRKKNGEPYIFHPLRVAETVFATEPDMVLIAVAFLHDVMEDCGETRETLANRIVDGYRFEEFEYFDEIIEGITALTEIKTEGNRAQRIKNEIVRLDGEFKKNPKFLIVKASDIMNNCIDISIQDQSFALTYIKEKLAALSAFKPIIQSLTENERAFINTVNMMLSQQRQALDMVAR